MTDVPVGDQGTGVRAIRGKQLHDASVAAATLESGQKRAPFAHGTRRHKEPFGMYPHVGDNFENKRNARKVCWLFTERDHKANLDGIHGGPFKTRINPHEPFMPDMELYDYGRYDRGDCKMPECTDKLLGTRFSKTRSSRDPWRPNNPAKRGHNKTLNKMHYYHQTLYYKPQEVNKAHQENIWM